MSIGRISGPLLKSNLVRNGVDLAFETDLLYIDVNNLRVGIKTNAPTHELQVNGTTRTTNLEATNQLDVGDINITDNTITGTSGTINLVSSGPDPVIYQTRLQVDSIDINANVISTVTPDTNLEIRPQGTGIVDIYSDVTVNGSLHATGNIRVDGNINIGNTDTDVVVVNADIASNLIPDLDDEYMLGNSDKRWADLWVNTVHADNVETGGLIVDNIDLNLRQGKVYYVATNGADTNSGTHQNDPYASLKKALTVATSGDTVHLYPGTYVEIFPLTVPVGVTVKGYGIRSVKIVPTSGTNTQDAFLLNGEVTIEDLTIGDFFYNSGNDTGYAFRFASNFTVTTRSPYIRNVSVLTKGSVTSLGDPLGFDQADAGRGAFLDGSEANSSTKEASCLFHSVTFITPGVDAIRATNGVRIEWLNCFTYYANRGMYLYSGSAGLAGNNTTQLRISGVVGTPAVGNTVRYYAENGSTVLATGTIVSIDADGKIYLAGKPSGFETSKDRPGKTVTVSGGAIITSSEKKWGQGSLALTTSTSDYLSIPSTTDFEFGTGAFTLETWFKPTTFATPALLLEFRTQTSQAVPVLGVLTTGAPYFYVNGAIVIQGDAGAVSTGTWHHIAVSRNGSVTKLYLDGVQVGSSWSDTTDYIAAPLIIGSNFSHTSYIDGYVDDMRVSKGIARYTGSTYSVPVSEVANDSYTKLLLRFNTISTPTSIDDEAILLQDIRITSGATPVATATGTDLIDYSNFGAEVRSIASACVYGTFGIVGSGLGVTGYLIGQNLAYIGVGKRTDNDVTYVIQDNEIVESNGAHIYYSSVDHKGDFRVGDLFYVNQADGTVTFSTAAFNVSSENGLTITDGSNTTIIEGSGISTGNLRIGGNTLESTVGPINISAANDQINLQNNVNISGNLDVVGNVTISGNITIGDQPSDIVVILGEIASDIVPATTNTYNLGTPTEQWLNLYSNRVDVGSFEITGNTIRTTDSNADLELQASGTGIVNIANNNVVLGIDLTVNGTTYIQGLQITGDVQQTGNIVQVGDYTQTGSTSMTGSLTVGSYGQFDNIRVEGNTIRTTLLNSDLNLQANGTGRIYIPSDNVQITQNLTVDGVISSSSNATVSGTVTASTLTNGNVSITGNAITTLSPNSNLELRANAIGLIYVPSNNVQFDRSLTVAGQTNLKTTVIVGTLTQTGTVTHTGNYNQIGNTDISGNLTVSQWAQFQNIRIDGNILSTTIGNSDLDLRANGTGIISVPQDDVSMGQNLTVVGSITSSSLSVTNTVAANQFSTGDILIDDNFITTTQSSSNLELRAHTTGLIYVPSNNVQLDQSLTVLGTTNLKTTNIGVSGNPANLVHIGNVLQTGDYSQTGNATIGGTLTVSQWAQFANVRAESNFVTTTVLNSNLELRANGTGQVYVPNNNVLINHNLTVDGTAYIATLNTGGTVTANQFSTGDILIDDNVITTTVAGNNLVLRAATTGNVYVPNNNVVLDLNLYVNGTANLKVTNIGAVGAAQTLTVVGAINHTGAVTQTGDYNLTGTLSVSNRAQFRDIKIDGNTITTTIGNNDLLLEAAGTGRVYVPSDDVRFDQNLTVVGTTTVGNVNSSGTITAATLTDGNISISGNTITTTVSNSNLQLQAAGTGVIELEQFTVQENEIRSSTNNNILFAPNGTGIVTINSTQSLRIPVGTMSERPSPALPGMIRYNTTLNLYEGFDGVNWLRLDGLYDSDGNSYVSAEEYYGANDGVFRFVSNGTQIADLDSLRFSAVRLDVGTIDINNNIISTTASNEDLIIQTQGTGATKIGNFAISGNTILNVVNNAVTIVGQTGDGYFKIGTTNGFVIPRGSSATRPGTLEIGMTRYNTDDGRIEVFNGSDWVSAAGSSAGLTRAEAEDIAIVSAIIFG